MAKKSTSKKKVSKKKASKKAPAAKKATVTMFSKKAEVDTAALSGAEAKKRCATIYNLERVIEAKRAVHEAARKSAAACKTAYKEAVEALEVEISEQRFGPGPLFSPDGSGPAKV